MRVSYNQPAEVGTVFTTDAFDSQIGKVVPLNVPGWPGSTCRVVAAKVADGGRSVELTLEIPGVASSTAETSDF